MGGHASIVQRTVRDEIHDASATNREEFGRLREETTIGKRSVSYDHIDKNGVPHKNSVLYPADILICKSAPLRLATGTASNDASSTSGSKRGATSSSSSGVQNLRRDGSTSYSGLEPCVVIQTSCSTNAQGLSVRRSTTTARRDPSPGDKWASMHAQKNTIIPTPDVNLPISVVTGLPPDIIINPHCFPSRMTAGQLKEMHSSKAASMMGQDTVDATAFTVYNQALYDLNLKNCGFQPNGYEMFQCPFTGEMMRGMLFTGFFFLSLNHITRNCFAVSADKTNEILIHVLQYSHFFLLFRNMCISEVETHDCRQSSLSFVGTARLRNWRTH
jgi:DNA-directed RNA polymerase II subunit RPB2